MDTEINKIWWRIEEARVSKDTNTHWQLQVAAIEAAFIEYFGLEGTEARDMMGRASPWLAEVGEEPQLRGDANDDEIKRCRDKATQHTKQARRMQHIAGSLRREGQEAYNRRHNADTMEK